MCSEYGRLIDAYRKATSEHAHAVAELATATGKGGNVWLDSQRCDKARLASESARLALDAHVAEHGCVVRTQNGSPQS